MSVAAARWKVLLALGLLTLFSLLATPYRFAANDDGLQAPLVLHWLDPGLLAGDPLVTEVAGSYQSALFPILGSITIVTSLPFAYASVFILVRFLLLSAYFVFCRALTGERRASLLAVALLTGFGFYGFGTYLGGVPLLEEKLVPRAAALPFALLTLASRVRDRSAATAAFGSVTLLLHPVTGVATVGLALVYALLARSEILWRRAVVLDTTLLALVGLYLSWIRPWDGVDAWRLDPTWRATIEASVGAWVFVTRDTAWSPALFPCAVALGVLALVAVPHPRVRRISLRFALATALAIALHAVAVDGAGLHALLLACPERASFVVPACTGAALGLLLDRRLREPWIVSRAVAFLTFVAILARVDGFTTFGLVVACCLVPASRGLSGLPARRVLLARTLLVVALASPLVPVAVRLVGVYRPSAEGGTSRLVTQLPGARNLLSLGETDPSKRAVQEWLRTHTSPGESFLPPLGYSIGWQVHSQRPSVWSGAMLAYVHLSPQLAARYEDYVRVARPLHGASWRAVLELAAASGANWLIVDARINPRQPGDPAPLFFAGPYRVLEVKPRATVKPARARARSRGDWHLVGAAAPRGSDVPWKGPPPPFARCGLSTRRFDRTTGSRSCTHGCSTRLHASPRAGSLAGFLLS